MPSSHRSPCQWFLDHRRHRNRPDRTAIPSGSDQIPQHSSRQPGAVDNPRESSTCAASTDTPSPASQIIATNQEAHDESPIWHKSVNCFATDHPERYKLIERIIEKHGYESVLEVDTWVTSPSQESRNKWLRRCKPYLPSLRVLKGTAATFANLDPHKVAPLIVSGVFFVIELCLDSFDPTVRDSAISVMLNTIELISKWHNSEMDLRSLKNKFPESDENYKAVLAIEEDLTGLYEGCLMLIHSVYESGKDRIGRAVAALPGNAGEWKRSQDQLNDKDKDCNHRKRMVELKVKMRQDNIKILDFIRIRGEDPEPKHYSIMERTGVNVSTAIGGWFVETTDFSSWTGGLSNRETKERLFWLRGPMGTGKTTLMCRVMSHFEERPISGVRFIPYYCYASGTSNELKAPNYETIVRALCRRLAWNSDGTVAEHARKVYDMNSMDTEESLTVKKTWEPLLETLVESSKSTVVFVIDALDECIKAGQYREFLLFSERLSKKPNGPYCLISSLPHVPVGSYFKDSFIQFSTINSEANSDMRKFITDQIDSRNNTTWSKSVFYQSPELRQRLEDALYKTAHGMFRWVEIWLGIFFPKNASPIARSEYAIHLLHDLEQLNSLNKLDQFDDDESMDSWKNKLGKAYSRLWTINGDEQYQKFQLSAFRIITGAITSLTPQQLLEAICLDLIPPDSDDSLCLEQLEGLYHNFLKVDEHNQLSFENHSAKIFISEMTKKDSRDLMFPGKECYHTLTDIVIKAIGQPRHWIWRAHGIQLPTRSELIFATSLLSPQPTRFVSLMLIKIMDAVKSAHFAQYVFEHWLQHCRDVYFEDSQFVRHMIALFNDAQSWLEFLMLMEGFQRYRPDSESFPFLALDLQAADALVTSEQGLSVSLFLFLVALNFSPFTQDTVRGLVLQEGVRNDIILPNANKRVSLHIACVNRNTTMVKNLLEFQQAQQGSCMALLRAKDSLGKIPMHYTYTEDIVKVLMEYEMPTRVIDENAFISQLDSQDSLGATPVRHLVSHCTDDYLVRLFEEYRLGPPNSLNRYILHYAAAYNKEKTVKLLVENGADVNDHGTSSIGDYYRDDWEPALGLATAQSIVEFLLNAGADPNAQRGQYDTPLGAAAYHGHVKIAKLLLNKGADINAVGDNYGTALMAAVSNGDEKMIEFLLEEKAEINASGGKYGTALIVAVVRGRFEITEKLIAAGADVDAQGGDHGTALSAAAYYGKSAMVNVLLDHQADINAKGGRYGSPLGAAIHRKWPNRFQDTAALLVSRGADISLLNEEDRAVAVRYKTLLRL